MTRSDTASRTRGPAAPRIVGRAAEVARVRASVDAGERSGTCLVVLGDLGTGRSVMADLAAEHSRARRRTVFTARVGPEERDRPYAGLLRLLAGVPSREAHLGAALESAVRTASRDAPDRIAVGRAVLALLTVASEPRPLTVVVDDVHQLDPPSLAAVAFACRHLGRRRVGVVLTALGEATPAGADPDVPALVLGPLTAGASAQLLDAQPHAPTGRARHEVLRTAEGNPLAITVLSRAPGAERTRGTVAAFQDAVRALPERTRALLLAAAAVCGGPVDVLTVAAAVGSPVDLASWSPAERAGLVDIHGDRVAFRHPLVRAAVLFTTPAEHRRAAHADLAEVLRDDPVKRAWHLSNSAAGTSESRAAELEAAGDLADRDGGHFEAACAYLRAAECGGPDRRARLHLKAQVMAERLGDPRWIQELHGEVRARTGDPEVLAIATCSASRALSLFGEQRSAFAMLSRTLAELPFHRSTGSALLSLSSATAYHSGLPEHRAELVRLLDLVPARPVTPRTSTLELVPPDADEAVLRFVTATARQGDDARGIDRTPREPASAMRLLALGGTAWMADELTTCADLLRRGFGLLSGEGRNGEFIDCFTTMVHALVDIGRWDEADAMTRHAHAVAKLTGSGRLHVETTAARALITAYRGDGEAATTLLDEGHVDIDLRENRAAHVHVLHAAGVAALAAGDPARAYRVLRRAFAPDGAPLHYFLSPRLISLLAIAAWRSGHVEEAAAVREAVETAAGARPTPRLAVLLHHSAALLDGTPRSEEHFLAAVHHPRSTEWPVARALAVMHFSEWLRKQHRPVEARPLLVEAFDSFTRLGALTLARIARDNLRAAGVSTARTASAKLADLTAQQQRVVRLAAKGMRNREIADLLFLSPRTVASHLYSAYSKLGITGRSQLRATVSAEDRYP